MPPARPPLWSPTEAPGCSGAVELLTGFLGCLLGAAARLPARAFGARPLPSVPFPPALGLPRRRRPLGLRRCCPGWLRGRGLAGCLGRIHGARTHQLGGSGCLAWISGNWRLKERSQEVRKGRGGSRSRCCLALQLSRSLPSVPYRLEADEVAVPLRFGVDDAPFLLLSLEN